MSLEKVKRILIVDDNEAIHHDFIKVLNAHCAGEPSVDDDKFNEIKAALFSDAQSDNESADFPRYRIDSAYQGENALEMVKAAILEKKPYSLAIVDSRMPGWDGIYTIQRLWEVAPDLQIIICTAYSDYSLQEMNKNLKNYENFLVIKKPVDAIEICQAVAALTKKWELNELAQLKLSRLEALVDERTTELIRQATHDTLTGLPNRSLLNDRIEQAIIQTKNSDSVVGVMFIDLDNFKIINDTLGHSTGDLVLKQVSKILCDFACDQDTVLRFGGDEFIIILPRIKEVDMVAKANELLRLFSTRILINDNQLNITISIGISLYPNNGIDTETLLKNADAALYQAKAHGRNTFQFYINEFNEYLLTRKTLIEDLHEAVKNQQFSLYYQPLINLKTGKITALEALLRWQHPHGNIIEPIEFVQIAEETGLIIPIGEWVLKTAFLQIKQWQDTIDPTLCVSINISPAQFKQDNFVEIVKRIIQETNFNASMIEFEITESLILDNTTAVVERMHHLKNLGIKFSMDDFGTGYASLNYLKSFPFDKIKIDKSFIMGLMHSRIDRSIVEAIIMMAKSMKLAVLAEGVTDEAEFAFLKQHATTEGQGHYFSPALNLDQCAELLRLKVKNGQETR